MRVSWRPGIATILAAWLVASAAAVAATDALGPLDGLAVGGIGGVIVGVLGSLRVAARWRRVRIPRSSTIGADAAGPSIADSSPDAR